MTELKILKELRDNLGVSEFPCDYCQTPVPFIRKYGVGHVFSWLEALEPNAGSDYLAIWCGACEPQHRNLVEFKKEVN
jgi:hypothetical protein